MCGTAVFDSKGTDIINCKFSIIDQGNFSTLHFDHDCKRFALNVLYGPDIDSPLFYKEIIFESDLNLGAEYIIYSGDWNVSLYITFTLL